MYHVFCVCVYILIYIFTIYIYIWLFPLLPSHITDVSNTFEDQEDQRGRCSLFSDVSHFPLIFPGGKRVKSAMSMWTPFQVVGIPWCHLLRFAYLAKPACGARPGAPQLGPQPRAVRRAFASDGFECPNCEPCFSIFCFSVFCFCVFFLGSAKTDLVWRSQPWTRC